MGRGQRRLGYGEAPKALDEFYARLKGLTDVLLGDRYSFGFCYTQLYDIEQEQNGLLYYDRTPKFPPEIFKKILDLPAEIEK